MFRESVRLQSQTLQMLMEAQMVVAMRLLSIFGVLPSVPGENLRMLTEKQNAFTESGMAASRAAMRGQRPAQIYRAALRPVGRKTHANTQRLAKRAVN